jgi:hypothetical protein
MVYIYTRVATSWSVSGQLMAENAAAASYFGFDVNIYDSTIVSSAKGTDDHGTDSGMQPCSHAVALMPYLYAYE